MLGKFETLIRNLARGKLTMAATPPVCNFGERAPDFELPATDGRTLPAVGPSRARKGPWSSSCAITAPT